MAHPAFAGRHCCWGDYLIEGCAQRRVEPGTQEMCAAGISHHLRIVTLGLQLASPDLGSTSRSSMPLASPWPLSVQHPPARFQGKHGPAHLELPDQTR